MSFAAIPHRTPRRAALRAFCALGAALLAPLGAMAQQDYPNKPIRIVVPFAPGGSADTLGRMIGKHLSEAFGQPVTIENRAGAGGVVGSQLVSKAPPDGYTLVVSGIASHVIAPAGAEPTYDPMKEFTHIAMLAGPPLALVVNGEQPVNDVKGFLSHYGADPKGVSFGSPGRGTHGHLTGELFASATKLNMVHIAYQGAGPAVTDLLSNQIPAGVMTLSSANAHFKTGKIKLLAVSSATRLPDYPNAPTFAELGYPALTGVTWFSLSGPPGMPAAVVDKINAEVRRGMQSAAGRELMARESMQTLDVDAAGFTRYVASEIARWTPVVKALGTAMR